MIQIYIAIFFAGFWVLIGTLAIHSDLREQTMQLRRIADALEKEPPQ